MSLYRPPASTSTALDPTTALPLGTVTKNQKLKANATGKPLKIKLTIPAVTASATYTVFAQLSGSAVQGTSTASAVTPLTIQPAAT